MLIVGKFYTLMGSIFYKCTMMDAFIIEHEINIVSYSLMYKSISICFMPVTITSTVST